MTATTDARTEIVDALTAAGITTYGYTPPTVIPPACYVEPDDPWIVPTRLGHELRAELAMKVVAVVNVIDAATSITALEQLVELALAAMPHGVRVIGVAQPTIDSTGSQGETLTAAISISAHITDTE